MNKVKIFILTVVLIIVGIVVLALVTNHNQSDSSNPGKAAALVSTAEALTSNNVKFYGASWCPHCAEQKAWFEKAVKKLPYVECATAGAGSPQTQICIDNKIETYPTWVFPNGERLSMEVLPIDLADLISHPLDETAKAELQKEKDAYLAKFNETQKADYLKRISDLKAKLTAK